jgi:hypothetical protein
MGFGIAAYANVPTRPTNSSNALSERVIFIVLVLASLACLSLGCVRFLEIAFTKLSCSDGLAGRYRLSQIVVRALRVGRAQWHRAILSDALRHRCVCERANQANQQQ